MITVRVQPEFRMIEVPQARSYSTCRECHHTFFPKNEDQHGLELCDQCIEEMRSLGEPVFSVHVKPRPQGAAE